MQYWLGITYFADKDFKRGAPWIRKAADQGLLMAQTKLAACYLNGEGVEKDLKTAAFWYRKAAAQGDSESQAWLKEHPSLN
jgi:TPR repeat protein